MNYIVGYGIINAKGVCLVRTKCLIEMKCHKCSFGYVIYGERVPNELFDVLGRGRDDAAYEEKG